MPRRPFLSRRLPKKNRRLLWTGNSTATPQTLLAGAANALTMTIVAPSDYQINAGLEPGGATVRRIRAALTIADASVVRGALYAMIVMHSAPGGLDFAANSADALISGDVLWYGVFGTHTGEARHIDIDVKSMRKLENESVSMVLEGVTATHYISAWAKALMQMP